MLVFYIFMAISFTAFTSEEAINQINADTLQGFTKKAFITTNDFDSIKMAIEKIKIDTESCADTIVDLQLGLSGLSHDERLVREKDLNRIINDFSNISSELLSISGADDQGDGLRENNDLQLQLNEIESELRALQSYVQTYLGHLKSQNEKWYFTKDGALFGENQTMSASGSQISSSVLIGQTFQVAKESKIASIKIRVGSSTPPYANVFISPFATTINTNTFVYANSCSNEGNFIFKYTFNDLQVSPSNIYLLGIRTRQNSSSVSLIKCDDAYLGSTNCLWIGTGARYSLDTIKTYDLIAQPNYDLCFDVDFASQTNIIMGAEGIEIKNETPITIDGYNVATVPDITSRIDNARNNIYQSISNFVFGTNAIADGSITENKIYIPLLITSSPICLTGYVGQQYHLVLDVNDRKRRIYWWPLGELPAGLRLTEQGVLCGIPEKAGDFIFNAEVLNEDNKKDQVRFYLKIDKAVSSEIKVGKGHID